MPSEEAFDDLIDSSINIVDDGFEKSATDGLKIAQVEEGARLLSFYDEITVRSPVWSVALASPASGFATSNYKNLSIYWPGNGESRLLLASVSASEGHRGAPGPSRLRLSINRTAPEYEMDVGGVVASDGRIGREAPSGMLVRADGKWHPITEPLDGCQAFEVMAGVGKPKSGKYALTHAFAVSTFKSSKSSITHHGAHYSSRCDQIDLRWSGGVHNYVLEMRTRCSYEQHADEEVYVQYHLTQLWFNPMMEGCVRKESR